MGEQGGRVIRGEGKTEGKMLRAFCWDMTVGMNRRGWICEICGMTGLKDQLCAGEALMTT